MKIAILDISTTSYAGDIDFSIFNGLGQVATYTNVNTKEQVLEATKDVDIMVVNKVVLDKSIIDALPKSIRLIAVTATGYDNVDIEAAAKRQIQVCNVPSYGTNSVAQLAFAFILNNATQLHNQIEQLHEKGWSKILGISKPMHEIHGKTLGIIGLGHIGKQIATIGKAFGMKIVAYSRTPKSGYEMLSLSELAQKSDYVIVSCALNAQTKDLVNTSFLEYMKQTAYLINVSRGGIVNESALVDALNNQQISGAALDVLVDETTREKDPLFEVKNLTLVPHIGWASRESRQRCVDITRANISSFIYGEPKNIIN